MQTSHQISILCYNNRIITKIVVTNQFWVFFHNRCNILYKHECILIIFLQWLQTWMHIDYLPPMVLKHHLASDVWYMCILKMALCLDIISDKQKYSICQFRVKTGLLLFVGAPPWASISFHFTVKGVNFSTGITIFSHDFVYPYDFEAQLLLTCKKAIYILYIKIYFKAKKPTIFHTRNVRFFLSM